MGTVWSFWSASPEAEAEVQACSYTYRDHYCVFWTQVLRQHVPLPSPLVALIQNFAILDQDAHCKFVDTVLRSLERPKNLTVHLTLIDGRWRLMWSWFGEFRHMVHYDFEIEPTFEKIHNALTSQFTNADFQARAIWKGYCQATQTALCQIG